MFGFFFTDQRVSSFSQVTACDADKFKAFFHHMLERGIYLAPSAFEAGFISVTHSDQDISDTVQAAAAAFKEIA